MERWRKSEFPAGRYAETPHPSELPSSKPHLEGSSSLTSRRANERVTGDVAMWTQKTRYLPDLSALDEDEYSFKL